MNEQMRRIYANTPNSQTQPRRLHIQRFFFFSTVLCLQAGGPARSWFSVTGTTPWKKPTDPEEAHRELKELKPFFDHKIIML